LKPIDRSVQIFGTKKEYETYFKRNYNEISEVVEIKKYNKSKMKYIKKHINDPDPEYDGMRAEFKYLKKYKVKSYKSIESHYNYAQVGVEILSMSKRIMNEVFGIAEDNGLKIYYQDTDSMHITNKDLKILEEKYNKKYNRQINGKALGQFHIDFELDGCKNVVSTAAEFLGKKMYVDRLQGENIKTGEIETGYHIRMKGVNNKCILNKCDKLNVNPIELYQKIKASGNEGITFNLCDGAAMFKKTNDYKIKTLDVFERRIRVREDYY